MGYEELGDISISIYIYRENELLDYQLRDRREYINYLDFLEILFEIPFQIKLGFN